MAKANAQRFAVIGLGRFGSRLAASLALGGQEVIGIDLDPQVIEDMRDRVTLAISLDASDDQVLRAHGIDQVDVAVVAIGTNLESAAMVTVALKQIGIARIISRAMNPTTGLILSRIGADEVVYPEDESADRLANRLANPHYLKQLELDATHSIIELKTPSAWVGKSLGDLHPRKELGINVVAIKRTQFDQNETRHQIVHLPSPEDPLKADDVLILVGQDVDLARLGRKT
ncbi:MAG: TrkA family potassium uptake protein [Phycisphaeraceae bacterium]